ncbi:MAG: hypothetical protein FI715_04850 [SAR202 cluster bacterium]|nr:hypothetical protein [SAR202 cluster bacterium]MQG61452.1 hypothetical protein [SAR202 cluster bacterium]MQG65363.1 hypothetical protein [SAR202 cluster bacterium]
MSTPTNTFRCSIEIGPRDGSRFQRVITVAGSENIYSVLPSTVLEMLPMAEVRIRIDGEPILGRHTMAAFGLAADHDEQKPVQADMFSS